MPIQPTYPGVYVQEVSSGVHTITGVSTSITAFIGLAQIGPDNVAKHIFSFADYQRIFGGLVGYSQMSNAVYHFFLNGGTEAYIIRLIGQNTTADSATLMNAKIGVLKVDALKKGDTGTVTELFIVHESTTAFTLVVVNTPQIQNGTQPSPASATVETYSGLTMDSKDSANYVVKKVNGSSKLIQVTDLVKDDKTLPDATTSNHGTLTSGKLADGDVKLLPSDGSGGTSRAMSLLISLDGSMPTTITPKPKAGNTFADLNDVASGIQEAVKGLNSTDPAYTRFTCTASNGTLVLSSGSYGAASSVKVLAALNDHLAKTLKLLPGTVGSASGYPLAGAQGGGFVAGEELNLFIGDQSTRQGIYALDAVDLFNILCLPGISDAGIFAAAISYCKSRRAVLLIDAPKDDQPDKMVDYITGPSLPKGDDGTYTAIYYPWVQSPDPLNNGKLTSFPPCGLIAGLYAATDSSRGVWKAPAGTSANLLNVQGLDYLLTNAENGELNQVGVNCLRIFPIYGAVCWGSRTVSGADAIGSDYKYVPVRRTALFIEESLYRGLQWVVFEPNDEPLWAQIRLNAGAFMHNLFRKGAFQGQTPRDAYFVKCDSETTTQTDIDHGIVNIIVGFAPLKPAEYVILSIQQIAGQIQV